MFAFGVVCLMLFVCLVTFVVWLLTVHVVVRLCFGFVFVGCLGMGLC